MSLVTPRKGYKSVPWLFDKEIEIPEEWRFQKIRECCNILDSKRIPINSEERKKIQGNIPYYGANGIQGYVNDHIFDEEIILLAEDGGYFEEYKTRPIAQYVIGKSWVNNHAHVLNTKKNILMKWVFYSLVHKNITQYINGSTRTKLNQSDLQKISILIPPLSEQQKIATILSNVDNLIESTVQVIAHSKKVKTGLMQKLLTRGIGHVTFKKVPWLFGKEIEIPEEWEVTTIGDKSHVTLLAGFEWTEHITLSDIGEVGIIRAQNVKKGIFLNNNIKFISNQVSNSLPRSKLHGTEVLFVWIGEVGNVCISPDGNWHLGKNVAKITPNDNMGKEFLCYFLQSELGRKNSISESKDNVQPSINMTTIRKFLVLLTSIEEQQKIATILSNVDDKITSQEQYKEKLENLKKSLMQKLLTGDVRV